MPFNNFTARPLDSFEKALQSKLATIIGGNSTATLRVIDADGFGSISKQTIDEIARNAQMLSRDRKYSKKNLGTSVIHTFYLGQNFWTIDECSKTGVVFIQKELVKAQKAS
ncbi:MAG: hypothetical protein Q4A21_01165 [bacterium]|nr:hypothetical protein [bacterium]